MDITSSASAASGRASGRRRVAALTALALGLLALVLPAGAVAGAAASADSAYVRAAHLVPDLPAMDVTLSRFAGDSAEGPTDPLLTITAGYGDVGEYAPIAPGFYAVALRPAGSPASSAPILTGTFRAEPGGVYTGAGVGTATEARLAFIEDDLSAPGDGKARIRVVNAARNADPVDVTAVSGPPVAAAAGYAQPTTYATVPAQSWQLRAQAQGAQGTATTDLASNAVYTLLVLEDGAGALSVRPVLDASGSGQVPVGGAATGLGGMATTSALPSGGTAVPLTVAALLIASGVAITASSAMLRRRR